MRPQGSHGVAAPDLQVVLGQISPGQISGNTGVSASAPDRDRFRPHRSVIPLHYGAEARFSAS